MTQHLAIRPIEDGDVAAVIALWNEAGVSRPWNDPVRDIALARRGPHSTILVCTADGSLAATAMIGEDGHRGWIYYVAASPERRGQGVGRAIMEAAEAWLAGRGIWKVQLLIREDNSAVRDFYEHLGYRTPGPCAFRRSWSPKASPATASTYRRSIILARRRATPIASTWSNTIENGTHG